ncbi:hypothetical protein [Streptomyces subrutilus]|uniref:hypothetical protein n=1 Tax=Streptomyces subrutilus TaxID=36818 RepID=UPI0034082F44
MGSCGTLAWQEKTRSESPHHQVTATFAGWELTLDNRGAGRDGFTLLALRQDAGCAAMAADYAARQQAAAPDA